MISTKSKNKNKSIKTNKNNNYFNYTSKKNLCNETVEEKKLGNLGNKIIKNIFTEEKVDNFPKSQNKDDKENNDNNFVIGVHDDDELKDIIRKV